MIIQRLRRRFTYVQTVSPKRYFTRTSGPDLQQFQQQQNKKEQDWACKVALPSQRCLTGKRLTLIPPFNHTVSCRPILTTPPRKLIINTSLIAPERTYSRAVLRWNLYGKVKITERFQPTRRQQQAIDCWNAYMDRNLVETASELRAMRRWQTLEEFLENEFKDGDELFDAVREEPQYQAKLV